MIDTQLPVIKFSFNWNNKLTNKAFTTIRIHNPAKYKINTEYAIELKGEAKGTAILKDITILKGCNLNEFICYLDTGYSKAETTKILKRMYKGIDVDSTLFDFCLLVYTNSAKDKELFND
jgi:hypothetical protein